ncbi:hypothetical protein C8F04DRAFT_1337735 [Mycena alexandri]|uniref:Uncharacterized protein n=1 Tax=Mycena alexandri TaxID=1745969 RepID=A0AAD6T035_9AGAR|nr:hypothetical protein C8F04DRAFT_1337735 [Mycena alexandri]
MMFSSVFTSVAVVLALSLRASAHAMPSPALGVSGLPARSDVQRLSTSSPCGSVNIASSIDTSTAVPAEADGTVMLNITNYNAGADGSRSVSVLVDPTGTGKKFVTAKVTKNGDAAPKNTGTQQVTLSLPAGTVCSGGKAKNLCLLSVKSTAGFGGCTVVSQLSASGADTGSSSVAASAPATTKTPCKSSKRRAAGTRAARAMRRSLHENPVF